MIKAKTSEKEKLVSKCCVCSQPWDRYIGKKKCYTCGVPVLMCDRCQSTKPDKNPETKLSVRCPLCIAENVTVPASEVDFTANGIKNKDPVSILVDRNELKKRPQKAAESILKWGGGHASQKKFEKKMKRRMCKFGSDCTRGDCFFAHPERESNANKESKKLRSTLG